MSKPIPKNRFAAIVALFISLIMPTAAKAQEAYAVEYGTTLTFYYDVQRTKRTGTVYNIGSTQGNTNITKAVFNASFNDYRPSTTEKWFYNCTALATIEGIENLNTENVTNMNRMFYSCKALTTIYCNYTWICSSSSEMFNACTSLKGAVPFDSSKNGVAMANPETGYFTKGGASSVSEINADSDNRPTDIYNLHGVKMHDDLQSLPAGIYIVNGKKVIVK